MKRTCLAIAVALLCAMGSVNASVPEGVEPLLLTASVNGKPMPDVVLTAWQADKSWSMETEGWKKTGVVLTPAEAAKPTLTTAELGVVFQVNEETLAVDIQVPATRMPMQRLTVRQVIGELSPAASGMLVNYSLAAQQDHGHTSVSAAHEVRAAGAWGQVSTTGQLNWSDGQAQYVRGDTRWQFDDYKRQISYQAGDVSSSDTQLGGIRIAKDPSLDPYTPTYPIPMIGGLSLDQGTLELMINRSRVSGQDVAAGPFVLERYPLASGRSALDVVIRDQFGREQVIQSGSVYLAPSLLRKDLTTWSVAAGKVRQGLTNDYGPMAAEFRIARGLTDTLTVSGSVQTAEGHQNATIGAKTVLGNAGVLEVEAGRSSAEGKPDGKLLSARYSFNTRNFGLSASHESSQDYWRMGSLNTHSVETSSRDTLAASFSSADRRWQSRLAYNDLATQYQGGEQRIRYMEAGLGWQKGAHTASGSVLVDLDTKDQTISAGYRYQFGRSSVYATARQAPDVTRLAVGGSTSTTVAGMPLGLQAEISQFNGANTARVAADLRTSKGFARASAVRDESGTRVNAEFAGSLHVGSGGVTTMETVHSGFAVVDVGIPGIPVRAGGRDQGITNKRGQLVVTGIPVLQPTTIKIDDRALPAGVQLERSEVTVTPRRSAGAMALFPVRTENARAFKVTRAKPLEAGAHVKSVAEETLVGFEGELYLEHPKPGQELTITDEQGTCIAKLPAAMPAVTEQIEIKCE